LPAGKADTWRVLVMDVPPDLADEISGCLADRILGAEHGAARAGATRLRLFLRDPEDGPAALETARGLLSNFGVTPESCSPRLERVDDEHWVERFQAALRPLPLGRCFVVFPGGDGKAAPGREVIRLTPGRAFGTGEHATTQLCAEELERRVLPGSRWLDLGCGTGILSIVALRSGAAEVLALDHDPQAIEVAEEVLAANGLAGRVRLRCGSVEQAGRPPWSGIVANIHAPFFLEKASLLAAALEPGGLLVASGFVLEQVEQIADALSAAGLRETGRGGSGPWVVWTGCRADGGRAR
jgi:ribosomal protein L11 methyltransferase